MPGSGSRGQLGLEDAAAVKAQVKVQVKAQCPDSAVTKESNDFLKW